MTRWYGSELQFERAWENALHVSGIARLIIDRVGEEDAKMFAHDWWRKGIGHEIGAMYWPDPPKNAGEAKG
jgi:hypothetical protein